MSTHYMQNNVYKICKCDYVNMWGRADSLIVKQYVGYSSRINGDTICVVQQTV